MQHALDLARPYWPLILAAVVWPIIGAALSWWLWWDTPAHWNAYAAAHPGRALAIRALRTVSPHLRKLVVAWRDYAAARSLALPVVPPSVGPLAPSVDPVAPPAPTPVEPSPVLRAATVSYRPSAPRETIAPPEVSDDHYAAARAVVHAEIGAPSKPAQGGHVEGGAMLGACVLALAAPLLCAGCPWVREGAMRASVVVSDPTDCVPLATRCVAGVPVVCSPSPVPGSNRHREWPMLPRDGRGMQRACAGGCVVDDAGAHCVAADAAVDADGGAL